MEGSAVSADNSRPAPETLPPPESQLALENKPEVSPPPDTVQNLAEKAAADVPSNEPKIDGVISGDSQKEQPANIGQMTPNDLETKVATNSAEEPLPTTSELSKSEAPLSPGPTLDESAKSEAVLPSDSVSSAEKPDPRFADVPRVVSRESGEKMTMADMREELGTIGDRIDEMLAKLDGEN
jgi:hypothetical protein